MCCLLLLDSVTSTPQWIRQPKPRDVVYDVCMFVCNSPELFNTSKQKQVSMDEYSTPVLSSNALYKSFQVVLGDIARDVLDQGSCQELLLGRDRGPEHVYHVKHLCVV